MKKLKIEFQPTRKGRERLFVDSKEIQTDMFGFPLLSSEIAEQIPVRKIPDGFLIIISGNKSGIPYNISLSKFKGIRFSVNINILNKLNGEMSEKEYNDSFNEALANKKLVIMSVQHEGFERPVGICFATKSWTVKGVLDQCDEIMGNLITNLK